MKAADYVIRHHDESANLYAKQCTKPLSERTLQDFHVRMRKHSNIKATHPRTDSPILKIKFLILERGLTFVCRMHIAAQQCVAT